MERTMHFVRPVGVVRCDLPSGESVDVPVVPGILKHYRLEDLPRLLQDSETLRKYTSEALRKAPWSVVRQFPREWLVMCLSLTDLAGGEKRG